MNNKEDVRLNNKQFEDGMSIRRFVLGNAYVDSACKDTTKIDQKFQKFITKYIWGDVWASDVLSKRDRTLVTLSILASLGHYEEFALHLSAAQNTGVDIDEIIEVVMHVAAYAGVPAANKAIKIAKNLPAYAQASESSK